MYNITDKTGASLDNTKNISVKVRLAKTYQKSDQTTKDIMEELKQLSNDDLQWFCDRFNEAGYPTNFTPAN